MRCVWRRTKAIHPDLQKRVHHPPLGRLEPTRRGPNASCTIRPVLSVIASHLEMAPTDESHLLVWCVRISFGGEVQRRDVPASERALREAPRPQSITCFYAWTRRAEMQNAETTSWGVMRRVASCRCSATRLFKAGVVSMRRAQSPRGIEPRMVPIQRQRPRAGVRPCQEHSQEILMDVSLRGQVERFLQDSDHEGFTASGSLGRRSRGCRRTIRRRAENPVLF
jgi:hypothetical protein